MLAGVAVLLLAGLPFVLSVRHTARLTTVAADLVAIVGLGLLARHGGRISLGHGAFMAVGGYTTALLAARHGVPQLAALPAAAGAGGAVGVLSAVPVLGRPGRYLALPTLGLAITLPQVLARYGEVVLPRGESGRLHYAVAWVLAGCVLLAALGARARFARLPALAAVFCSAACAGLGGGLIVLQLGQATAGAFPLRLSLTLVAAAAVGFYGSAWGALLGAFALEYLPDLVGVERAGQGPATFAFGVALVVLMLASPLAAVLARRARR